MTELADTPGELVLFTSDDGLPLVQAVVADKADFAEIARLSKREGGAK